MIKNDFRYIIKKILIAIGIILAISFLKQSNVLAYDTYSPSDYTLDTNKSLIVNNSNYQLLKTHYVASYYRNILNGDISFCFQNASVCKTVLVHNIPFEYNRIGISSMNNLGSTTGGGIVYLTKDINLPHFRSGLATPYYGPTLAMNFSQTNYNNTPNLSDLRLYSNPNEYAGMMKTYNQMSYFSNVQWNYYESNYSTVDIELQESFPEIVSLNPVLNKTDDNMLVSVSFSPEFSYIDTDNYNYYAWFEGYDKLLITENNITVNTQKNTTFYVEITDKEGNTIDSQTYTVSSIGLVYNGDYDIQFKIDEYSQSDTENNTDEIFDIINRIDIDIMYIPKWVNYKYQYQYVPQNESLTDDWVLVNDNNDKNNVVYTVSLNGTMYARILDENNNVLKSETFTITRIGAIKTYDKNKDKFYGMFNIIKEELNFGGPISDLIVLPVNVLQAISNASNKVCIPYDLGSIGGHHIVLPCIEPEHYLGSALWTTIDLIFSGCMFFAISKWFTSAYYKFILLDNTPGIKGRRDLD